MAFGEDIITSSSGISEYVSAWLDNHAKSQGVPDLTPEQERLAIHELCGHLYENLSILDTKSSALIGSNAMATALLAALSFVVPPVGMNMGKNVGLVAFCLLLPSLLSLLINVTVNWVYWSTTKELVGQSGIRDRARSLIRLRSERTRRYRIAFGLHIFVLLCAAAGIAAILLRQLPL